jgi:SulP family sulfate permease
MRFPGFASLRGDLFGGLTAAVVALPLALAFGLASGAGPVAGLYGAIAVGFFASVFGGTPAQVSGPTGPMTVVMAAVVVTHADSLAGAFTIVMLGGLFQIGFGVLRVGRYIAYTPVSVVSGFMSGVGVIIMLLQLLPFLGLPASTEGVPGSISRLASLRFDTIEPGPIAFAGAALALVVLWPKRLTRILPSPLVVLVLGTAAAYFFFPGLPTIGAIPSALPSFVLPEIGLSQIGPTLQSAFILALLGSIDSLLTSLVSDSLTKTRHNSDRELIGQGLGNLVAGMLGAIPGAGATMRTVVNIRAGGRTPISGVVHALALLGLALGLGPVVSYVPTAVLAAILMKVGWDIVDWGYLRRAHHLPREKVVVMLVTLGLTIFVDLITAVAVGVILASFVNSHWLAVEQLKGLKQSADADALDDLTPDEKALLRGTGGRVLVTLLHGSFSYASARDLAHRDTQAATPGDVVIYDFTHAGYIDPSAAMAIDEMVDLSQQHGRYVIVSGLKDHAYRALKGMRVMDRLSAEQQFADRPEAIRAAVAYCESLRERPKPALHEAEG